MGVESRYGWIRMYLVLDTNTYWFIRSKCGRGWYRRISFIGSIYFVFLLTLFFINTYGFTEADGIYCLYCFGIILYSFLVSKYSSFFLWLSYYAFRMRMPRINCEYININRSGWMQTFRWIDDYRVKLFYVDHSFKWSANIISAGYGLKRKEN